MVNEELYKLIQNKVTREEYSALMTMLQRMLNNVKAEEFYLRPLNGIPLKDLDENLRQEIAKIEQCYRIGRPINAVDLPSNVATKDDVNLATRGINNTEQRARGIIDEVVAAREGVLGITLLGNIQRRALKAEIIKTINDSEEELTIDKELLETLDHNEMTLLSRSADECHPAEAISYGIVEEEPGNVKDYLDAMEIIVGGLVLNKANQATLIEEINAQVLDPETPQKITADRLDIDLAEILATVEHNDIPERDEAGCHPATAISYGEGTVSGTLDTLVSGGIDKTKLDIVIGGNKGVDGVYDPNTNYGTIDDRLRCLEELVASLLSLFTPPVVPPACIVRPPGWFS